MGVRQDRQGKTDVGRRAAVSSEEGEAAFSRADVVFTGVDHSSVSYEVRLSLNNPSADVATPRTPEAGYAGRFTVFGHGGCYGDSGHCDVPSASTDPTYLRPAHPLTPLDTYVTRHRFPPAPPDGRRCAPDRHAGPVFAHAQSQGPQAGA
ncbi:MAG: hypothetical protein ACRDZ4_03825 [Egibacteraceae bacterium]